MKLKSSITSFVAASLLSLSMASGQSFDGFTTIDNPHNVQNQGFKKAERFLPRAFAHILLHGDYLRIYHQTSASFQEDVSFTDFKQMSESFNQGVHQYKLETHFRFNKHSTIYVWADGQHTKGMRVVFNKHGTIQELRFAPLASYPKTDHIYTENEYTFPVQGRWFVFWGGTNQLINYHYLTEMQRYAYDLVIMRNGSTHHGNPNKNKHYYAFRKKVTAPADGKVVEVVDDIHDNVPGEMNVKQPLGNHVVLQHKNGEYSLMAHLKEHSITVHPGEYVERGDVLGQCGNSGNSSEPHIHFQVMDAPNVFQAKSIRIQFENGKEPIQGDFIHPMDDLVSSK